LLPFTLLPTSPHHINNKIELTMPPHGTNTAAAYAKAKRDLEHNARNSLHALTPDSYFVGDLAEGLEMMRYD
jgi:hypothetical protein